MSSKPGVGRTDPRPSPAGDEPSRSAGALALTILATVALTVLLFAMPAPAAAQIGAPPVTAPTLPTPDPAPAAGVPDTFVDAVDSQLGPRGVNDGTGTNSGDATATDGTGDLITITVGDQNSSPSQSIILIVGLGILSLAPSLVIMLSSFTRIVIVLSLTRNALGLQGVPPNQVIVGLALFLSLFIMGPTLTQINDTALQPYLDGQLDQSQAIDAATGPVRDFMLAQKPGDELAMILDARGAEQPATADDISLTSLIPAFLLHELKAAFIIGMVIFIPFVMIDLIVSATLMSLGMMMLPPVFVSLPFKLLLFVMVGGWSLIVQTLLQSFNI
jgi:flagellar biosynthetic protein FliP